MPDSINDDTLISQDDIDKLLSAGSVEEAEETFVNSNNDIDDSTDDLGELSQDDIDSLMNASALPDDDDDSDDSDDVEEDDLGELSQDDIDSLLSASDISDDGDVSGEELLDYDLVSQDDIDSLMSTEPVDDGDLPDDYENDILSDSTPSPDELINESEAWDVKDSLITQETLDALMNAGVIDEDEKSTPLASDLDLEDLSEDDSDLEDLPEDDFQVDLSDIDAENDIDSDVTTGEDDDLSDEGMEGLLGEDDSGTPDEFDKISQDDIDGFLDDEDQDSLLSIDDTDEEDPRNVISQGDIDALLAGSDEDDEDLLADMEKDENLDFESGFGDEPSLDEGESSDVDDSKNEIEHLADQEEGGSSKRKRSLIKIVLSLFLVLIIIGGSVAGIYFFFLKDKIAKDVLLTDEYMYKQNDESGTNITMDSLETSVQDDELFNPGSLVIEGFVILAPEREDGITYISGDISIDYSYSKVFDELSAKMPYYRHIIYKAITNALESNIDGQINEKDLLGIIKQALNQSLPGMQIDSVIFTEFTTG